MTAAVRESEILKAARRYAGAGLCVLPADPVRKYPTVERWGDFQEAPPTPEALEQMCAPATGLCLICGEVSGNLEVLDFDFGAVLFEAWKALVSKVDSSLFARLVIQRTQSGGRHVLYCCHGPVEKSLRLARRWIDAAEPGWIDVGGKRIQVRQGAEGCGAVITLIETRGQGGLVLCAPTEGYELLQGELTALPTISPEERDVLIQAARDLNEYVPKPVDAPPARKDLRDPLAGVLPGDDFNARGDIRPILKAAGWSLVRGGENEHWCRPGKKHGTSATLKDGVLYVFSSNASPFEADRAYSGFAVVAMLKYGGDFSAAAKELRRDGFGGKTVEATPNSSSPSNQAPAPPPATSGAAQTPVPAFRSLAELVDLHGRLRPPLIEGLLRRGEIMNIIAAPKVGKSWLCLDLAMAIASGELWLERFKTVRGRVLIIDNELHPETSASRAVTVASARSITVETLGDRVLLDNLRGRLVALEQMDSYFRSLQGQGIDLIILDAFYRFLPDKASENDNAVMAQMYNQLDRWAQLLNCCFILVHHTSKGIQSERSVTDVGAGAGSQARAADTHLVLRPHEQEDCVVLDAAVRSWPPLLPCVLRKGFPLWRVDPDLDPTKLRQAQPGKRRNSDGPAAPPAAKPELTPEQFTERYVLATPEIREAVIGRANADGVPNRKANTLLNLAVEAKLVFCSKENNVGKVRFSTTPPPPADAAGAKEGQR